MAKREYRPSPPGIARYAWINTPDTKYNQDGLYHVELVLEGEAADQTRTELEALAQAGFDAGMEELREKGKLKKGEEKKWGVYQPYEEETDSEGHPTGRLIVRFKQNAKLHLPDGSFKTFKVGIRDAKDNETSAEVWSGSTIRVMWAPRNIVMSSLKKAGVRLDFCLVQLIKPAAKKGRGFDEVEGGYVDESAAEDTNGKSAHEGDY